MDSIDKDKLEREVRIAELKLNIEELKQNINRMDLEQKKLLLKHEEYNENIAQTREDIKGKEQTLKDLQNSKESEVI